MLSGGQMPDGAQDAVAAASLSPAEATAASMHVPPGVLGRDQGGFDTRIRDVAADLDRGRTPSAAQRRSAPVDTLPPAIASAMPTMDAPGADLAVDQEHSATQVTAVGGNLNGDQGGFDAHLKDVAVSAGDDQIGDDTRVLSVDPADALLLILADALDDLERTRIANENRLRALRQVKGLEGTKAEAKLEVLTESLAKMEHAATLELQRAMRAHPFGLWVKRTVGLGEKQAARLIAAVGDPAWNHAEDRPRRGPAELWAYCGYAPGQKRAKGVQSNWNADAKMRAYLCAESCMKQRSSPYRAVYDRARENWAERDTSDGHKHAHALRCVAKEILKDLWREASTERPATSIAPPSAPVPQHNGKATR